MADEKITIKIDVDANTTAIEKATQATKRLKREAGKSSGKKEIDDYVKDTTKSLKKSQDSFKKHFDTVDAMTQKFGKSLGKFLSMAIKGVIAEMALLSATMIGIHALFAAGGYLAKAYNGGMKLAAAGAAALTVALATGVAAMREQQAAMYAYRGKGANEFGAGINQVRVAMRGLQMDQDLAGLGAEALNKAYAVMSKTMSTPQINASNKLFKNLMDFGSAGQDPAKATEKVGAVIEAITGAGTGKNKKSLSQTLSLVKQLGPEAVKALKTANVKTKEQLKKMITSGELAKLGGVEGQFDTTNGTLMGSIKKFKNLLKGLFGDFGLTFLEPAKVAMQKIFNILKRDIRRLTGVTSAWGSGAFMDGLVTAVDKVSTFFVNLIQKWLPKSSGQMSGMSKWWNNMLRTFNLFKEALRKYIEPAKTIEKAFKPIWTAIKDNGIKNLNAFREGILENKDEILEFGSRIGQVINAVGDLAIGLKKAFFDVLPMINDVLKGITDIFKMLTTGLTASSGTGMLGSMAPLLGAFIMSGKMGRTKGGVMPMGAPGSNEPLYGPTPTGAPLYAATPGRGYLAPRIDEFGNQTNAIRPTKDYIAQQNLNPIGNKLPYGKKISEFKRQKMMMRYNRSETVGAQKTARFNDSAMARMGTSMALTYGSQFAPEEMRGAMALGGMVGAVNPMAGIAVAGIGGAMKAKSVGAGAVAGAAGGAAIGNMIGGPEGAAVGAALGLIAGGIMGGINKIKAAAKEARGAIDAALGGILTGVMKESYSAFQQGQDALEKGKDTSKFAGSLIGTGGKYAEKIKGLRLKAQGQGTGDKKGAQDFLTGLKRDGTLTKEQFDTAMKSPEAALKQFITGATDKEKAFKKIDEVNNKRLEKLKQLTGKTAPELEKLAKNMGVDLYDATMSFDDMVTKLKINMIKSAAEMKAANQNTFMDTSIYDEAINSKKTQYSINDKTRVLGDRLQAGTVGKNDTEIYDYLSGMSSDLTALHGGDAISAFYDQQQLIGKGGKAYTAGGALQGQESMIAGNEKFQKQQTKVLGGFSRTGAEQITALLGDNNLSSVGGSSALQQQILGLSSDKQQKLLSDLQAGTLTGMGINTPASQKMTAEESLKSYGLNLSTEKLNDGSLDTVADSMDTASVAFKDAVTQFTTYSKDFFSLHPLDKTPAWFTKESFDSLIKSDTSSPRGKGVGDTTSSRLSQTMARHSSIDSQLTGSRNITSSYRTTGLGSINSDHITGRALDLTGQNLGQYARLTHANGGFAEFHGRGETRHLHVVPGPGQTGDTTSPMQRSTNMAMASSSGTTYNINFSISGGPNSSPTEIAQTVMRKIRETQENYNQRS